MVVPVPLFLTPSVFGEVAKVGSPRAPTAVLTTARPSLPSGVHASVRR